MIYVLFSVAAGWYVLRGFARIWTPARRVVVRIVPYTRRWHAWVLTAPATYAYIAVFMASTIVQRTAPTKVIDALTESQSTNLHMLDQEPGRALTTSLLWVADDGFGLPLYLVAFGFVVAYAERRFGTPRIIVICLAGHVLGTLATVRTEILKYGHDVDEKLANSVDVGVSYVMVSGLAAALLAMPPGRLRWIGIVLFAVGVISPVVLSRAIWDLGHLYATITGLAVALAVRPLAPLRVPPDFTPQLYSAVAVEK
jgi:hypothetical protein